MKLRITFSTTRKFNLILEENDTTLWHLKCKILKFISGSYQLNLDNISISLNGIDPLLGDESTTLFSIGIVNGDKIYILWHKNNDALTSPFSTTPLQNCAVSSAVKVVKPDRRDVIRQKKPITLLDVKNDSIPDSVTSIFEFYKPNNCSEAMNLLIHVLMYEFGFRIAPANTPNGMTNLPQDWRQPAVQLNYIHPDFNSFECTLALVTMGDIKQVMASFCSQESEMSIILSIKDYIPTNLIVPHRLKQLQPLSVTMKYNLLYPLKVAAQELMGIQAPLILVDLPVEILHHVGSHLDVSSIIRLSATCLQLKAAFNANKFWYDVYRRDFCSKSKTSKNILDIDWKIEYKEEVSLKKKCEKGREMYDPDTGMFTGPTQPLPIRPDFQPNPYFLINDPDNPYFGGEVPFHPGSPFNPNPYPRGLMGPFGDIPGNLGSGPQFPYTRRRTPRRSQFEFSFI